MNPEDYADDVLEQFDNHTALIPADTTDDALMVTCDCPCGHERNLREGNRATVVATFTDDEWAVAGACCKDNSIRDLYETTVAAETPTAVVEGDLVPVPGETGDGSWSTTHFGLADAIVWDVHTPAAP